MKQLFFATMLGLGLAGGAVPARADLPPLNRGVIEFADANLGRQVGRGECWDLADQALASAEARRPLIDYPGQTYVFGRPVGVDQVQPGDILQIDDVTFPGLWTIHHHTAVVHDVSGTRVRFIEQNVAGVRRVVLNDVWYDLAARRGGTLTIFRPEEAADGRSRWGNNSGSLAAAGVGGHEGQPADGCSRNGGEAGRTIDYTGIVSADADAIHFRLYADQCDRHDPRAGAWRYGAADSWR